MEAVTWTSKLAGISLLCLVLALADPASACVPWRPKVYFQPGTVRLLDEQQAVLDDTASAMQGMSDSRLVLVSQTETWMDRLESQRLAARRAELIAADLVERGVARERLSVRAEGSEGMRDTVEIMTSNYVQLVLTDNEGGALACKHP